MMEFSREDPDIPSSNTGDPSSFAYSTVRARWPKILTQVQETVATTIEKQGLSSDDAKAGRHILQGVAALKGDLAEDAVLQPLPDDGGTDIADYNAELTTLGGVTWRKAPWLYLECYLYRILHTFFTLSGSDYWSTFDVFAVPKDESLTKSKVATLELAARVLPLFSPADNRDSIANLDQEAQKALFDEILQISLWGNATDLSLLTTVSLSELQSRQGRAAREASKANVLADDTDAVWSFFSSETQRSGDVHIVLDNAGFELLTDLVLAGYLIKSGLAKRIVLHGKWMPWFVSDVNPHDLDDLVQGFANATYWDGDLSSEQVQTLKGLGDFFNSLRTSGHLSASYSAFWTSQHSFGRLRPAAPELYSQLAAADLVIFKGDLNYRKLVYDGCWPKATPFSKAIGPLAKQGTGLRCLALRTAKADVCVGLPEGMEDKLEKDWAWTGKYGVISYSEPK